MKRSEAMRWVIVALALWSVHGVAIMKDGGVPAVLDQYNDPDIGPRGPGLWDPLANVGLRMDLSKQEKHMMNGETAAVAQMAGQAARVAGTYNTVKFNPVLKPAPKAPVHQMELGEDEGVRKNSLLLAKSSFVMQAASREDGADVEERSMESDALIQLDDGGYGGDLGEADDSEDPDLRILQDEKEAKDASNHMAVDDMEASMIAGETVADGNIGPKKKDLGDAKLPVFPTGEVRGNVGCEDKSYTFLCANWKKRGKCRLPEVSKKCRKTCNRCDQQTAVEGQALAAPPRPKNPGDCVVSKWDWSTCSDQYDGTTTGTRKVLKKQSGTGMPCPTLMVKVRCNTGGCHQSCQTCRGKSALSCTSCYDVREGVLNAQKLTNDRNTTFAWKPLLNRDKILQGEAGYQFKMLSLKRLTGTCVWEEDIRTTTYKSTDGNAECTWGCDPPALMGKITPGYVCTKTCKKKTWAFHEIPNLALPAKKKASGSGAGSGKASGSAVSGTQLSSSKNVYTGKAARPTCKTKKTLSCAPERKRTSKEAFTMDTKMKCTVRKSARCVGVNYGTYVLHKTAPVQGQANIIFLEREYNTKISTTCEYDAKKDDYKACKLQAAELSAAEAFLAKQPGNTEKNFVLGVMKQAYKEGWTQMTLNDGFIYFVKFTLSADDPTLYGCLSNDVCHQHATMQ